MRLANHTLASWLIFDAIVCVRLASTGRDLVERVLIGAILAWLALCALRRGRARAVDHGGEAWSLVILSVILPFAFAAVCRDVPDRQLALCARWAGLLCFGWSARALAAGFSVLPHARDVVATGPYQFIRHPMYAAYIAMDASWWINDFAWPGFALWTAEILVLFRRAQLEERCLAVLPGYAAYARSVEHRFFPGLV